MNASKKIAVLLAFLTSAYLMKAQPDSTILPYETYLENIRLFHPLARKAKLQNSLGEAERLAAKGNLDPAITSDWIQKNFDEKLYYRQYQGMVRVPTKWGLDFTGGYENTRGVFLNPENNTSEYGLWHLGVEVNILQGLIVNERKIAFDQAAVFQNLTENERQLMMNELIYTASVAYLNWQQYFNFQKVLLENIEIANTYSENTKLSFENGEKTAMDTLEAFMLYQDAVNMVQKNETALLKARQGVENYLWYDEAPLNLELTTRPEDFENAPLASTVDLTNTSSVNNHPLILSYLNKQTYYEIEQRLKREKLKPKLKIKYNPLLATSDEGISPAFSLADYKWGFDFSMPLLFRTEKAKLQKGAIKIQQTALDIENKRNELQNKIENSIEQQSILNEQVALLVKNLEGYRLLLEGENEKFKFGESSVFLLNKRQEKYINGRLKLIELRIKQQLERLNYLYYSNQLPR